MTHDPKGRAGAIAGGPNPFLVSGAIAATYLLAGFLGPWIHADPGRVVTPAAGVALAALLLFGARYGIVIWLAATIVSVTSGLPVGAALLTGAASAIGAAVGALLLAGAEGFRFRMDRVRDVAAFAVLGVLASPAVAAFIGGPALIWTGEVARGELATVIVGWWLSDGAGILLVTPLILALVADHRREGWPRAWPVEAGLGLLVTALLAVALFGGRVPNELAEAALLLPVPFLVWGVFRFGLHGAASVMAVVAGVVVWRSAEGFGPFAEATQAGANAPLWIYLITLGFVALLTWALVAEHRSSLQRFQAVFDHSSDGIILLHHGRVAHCNPAAVELFGTRSPERLLDLDIDELSPDEQPGGGRSSPAMDEHLRETDRRGSRRFEWVLERREGTTFPAEISLSPVVVDGEPGHLAVVRDVSDRKARQEAVERAREEAEAADRAKTAYLAEVSHKIRTALNTNLGFARMIGRDSSLPAKHREYLQKVLSSGESLLGLVDEVLETSRIESDRIGSSVATTTEPGKMLRDLASTFRGRADEKGIGLDVDVADDVPERVLVERSRLEQVLTVLLGNAVKATDEGEVTVRAARGPAPDDATGVRLVVEVGDTGPGLSAEEQEKLFDSDAFEPGEPGSSRTPGLPEARKAAREMGGDLTVESRPGEGSRFRLEIPVRRADTTAGPDEAGPVRRVTGLGGDQPSPRILIVDDTEENRTLLDGLLTRVGFDTRLATDGREALEAFGSWRPDLVLMDQQMPVMDGKEATRRIKASEEGRETPVVMVTAGGFGQSRDEAVATGADGYVRVPFHETELLREIGRHLGVSYVYEE